MNIEQVWLDYRKRLLHFINARIGSGVDPEDILQTVFEKTLKSCNTLKSEAKLAPWLFRITENAIADEYRKRRRTDTSSDPEFFTELPDDQPVPENMEGLTTCLIPFVENLEEPYREAIKRVELEGLTHNELAAQLGVSVSAIKSRVQRGRHKLLTMLTDCCSVEKNHQGQFVDYTEKRSGCSL